MKKIYMAAALALCLYGNTAMGQTAEEKAWMAYMTPGKPHQMMAEENGTWTCEMTFWHEPGSKPEKSTTTATIGMIMGGRYQEQQFTGNMMGMPFEGKGTLAFDNTTQQYTTTWIDNMGTGMMVMKGKQKSDKVIELTGEMVDPVEGKPVKCREVYTVVDANTRRMEMYDLRNGKEFKTMEILMKRK